MFEMISHHDTTNLSKEDLVLAEKRAKKLEEHVLDLYQKRWMEYISPPSAKRHIDKILQKDTLLTSVRRAISNLTRDGYLEKTDVMVDGGHGSPVHCWKLKQKDSLFGDSVEKKYDGGLQ
ncbi:MAG: hypothetical protein ISR74_06750 [Candidatus Thioglobus sp.]|nr:hypothetical protein [Candidatus Thioglobus sp.]